MTNWEKMIENGKTCSEKDLFEMIYALGGVIWRTTHDIHLGRYKKTPCLTRWLKRADGTIVSLVQHTHRFGVNEPTPEDGSATPAFWEWYKKMIIAGKEEL